MNMEMVKVNIMKLEEKNMKVKMDLIKQEPN
jgi:hypothetical protein